MSALHRYEKLRYPDFVLTHGLMSVINIKKSAPLTGSALSGPQPKLELCLEETLSMSALEG
jgi:hypothetical protein